MARSQRWKNIANQFIPYLFGYWLRVGDAYFDFSIRFHLPEPPRGLGTRHWDSKIEYLRGYFATILDILEADGPVDRSRMAGDLIGGEETTLTEMAKMYIAF